MHKKISCDKEIILNSIKSAYKLTLDQTTLVEQLSYDYLLYFETYNFTCETRLYVNPLDVNNTVLIRKCGICQLSNIMLVEAVTNQNSFNVSVCQNNLCNNITSLTNSTSLNCTSKIIKHKKSRNRPGKNIYKLFESLTVIMFVSIFSWCIRTI